MSGDWGDWITTGIIVVALWLGIRSYINGKSGGSGGGSGCSGCSGCGGD